MPVNPVFVRGCSQTLTKSGFVNATIQYLDRYDRCYELPMYLVLNSVTLPPGASRADLALYIDTSGQQVYHHKPGTENLVRVCSCLGHKCNTAMSVNVSRTIHCFNMTL